MKNRNIAPMLKAIIAAALFGASAPTSKVQTLYLYTKRLYG
ncbi:MAG: hypothetical protein ACYCV0_03450 [Desulfitobacteriaceae bacterium]